MMHKFIASMSSREIFLEQLPAFGVSLITAELFYKFHSFTLECLAFLATWYLVDLLIVSPVSRFLMSRQAKLKQGSQ
jgi:hypothetical protein